MSPESAESPKQKHCLAGTISLGHHWYPNTIKLAAAKAVASYHSFNAIKLLLELLYWHMHRVPLYWPRALCGCVAKAVSSRWRSPTQWHSSCLLLFHGCVYRSDTLHTHWWMSSFSHPRVSCHHASCRQHQQARTAASANWRCCCLALADSPQCSGVKCSWASSLQMGSVCALQDCSICINLQMSPTVSSLVLAYRIKSLLFTSRMAYTERWRNTSGMTCLDVVSK